MRAGDTAARRYHWLGERVRDPVDEPHAAIASSARADGVLDLAARPGGTPDVYVHAFPGGGAKIRVSTEGANRVRWSRDGRSVYVTPGLAPPTRIYRVDLVNRTRTLWKEIHPSQSAGVRLSQVFVTPDGGALLHSYSQLLSTLYVVSGLAPAAGSRDQ